MPLPSTITRGLPSSSGPNALPSDVVRWLRRSSLRQSWGVYHLPRSRMTTPRPATASSLATMPPAAPAPIMTAFTLFMIWGLLGSCIGRGRGGAARPGRACASLRRRDCRRGEAIRRSSPWCGGERARKTPVGCVRARGRAQAVVRAWRGRGQRRNASGRLPAPLECRHVRHGDDGDMDRLAGGQCKRRRRPRRRRENRQRERSGCRARQGWRLHPRRRSPSGCGWSDIPKEQRRRPRRCRPEARAG